MAAAAEQAEKLKLKIRSKFVSPEPTESNYPQGVPSDPGAAECGVLQLLRSSDLFALLDHVGEPEGPPVQVQDQAEGGVGDLLHAVAGNVADSDPHLAGGLHIDVVDPGADPHDDPQGFKFLQIFLCKLNGVPHQSTHGFIKNLNTVRQ